MVPKYVGKYVPVGYYVRAYDSSPPDKELVRSFFGYAVDVGAYFLVSVLSFLGYAVEVGACVSSGKLINSSPAGKGWMRAFFGYAVDVGAFDSSPPGAYVPVGKYVGAYDSSPPDKGWVRSFFRYAVGVGEFVFVPVLGLLGYAVEVGALFF